MPKIAYIEKRFTDASRALIDLANAVIAEYQDQGFVLTLRQLYYQLVARGYIPNRQTEYKRLGALLNDARLAGLVDWTAIEDRTRNLRGLPHWENPQSILRAAARGYHLDRWADQPNYIEVWIEKDALVGVIEGVCTQYDVPYFSCRGYTSASEMWLAAQRLRVKGWDGKGTTILHLGDHDPSGIDMTRDIAERLALFGAPVDVVRIALTMDQVAQYDPPPNPAKFTDARYGGYVEQFGEECWELDALEPTVLAALIAEHVEARLDRDLWEAVEAREAADKERLTYVADDWEDIAGGVEDSDDALS